MYLLRLFQIGSTKNYNEVLSIKHDKTSVSSSELKSISLSRNDTTKTEE